MSSSVTSASTVSMPADPGERALADVGGVGVGRDGLEDLSLPVRHALFLPVFQPGAQFQGPPPVVEAAPQERKDQGAQEPLELKTATTVHPGE
jgi:hypothetical protein